MTNQEKLKVQNMRGQGYSYSQISQSLGLSINTVKSFCRRMRNKKRSCKQCGKPLAGIARRNTKLYCSEYCRRTWWKANRNQTRQTAYRAVCRHCGQVFKRYGKTKRTYCSHRCYIRYRYHSVEDVAESFDNTQDRFNQDHGLP